MNANVSKTNGVKHLAVVAVLAMVVCVFAAIMPAEETEAASNNGTTYLSGEITATQEYGNGTNVIVDGNLTIPAGMAMIMSGTGKLTIESDATLTIEAGGQLILQGTPTVIINGDIIAEGTESSTSTATIEYIGAIVNNTTYDADGNPCVVVSGDITLEKGAELVTSNNEVDLNDDDRYIINAFIGKGVIVLNNGASINVTETSRYHSIIANQDIYVNSGATVSIDGLVDGTVTINAVGAGANYIAASASISNTLVSDAEIDSTSDLTFTVTTQNTSAVTSRGSDDTISLRQYILNIDGTVGNGDVLSTAEGDSTDTYYEPTGYGYQIFPIVTVDGNLTVGASSDLIIIADTQMNVSGTLIVQYDEDLAGDSSAKPAVTESRGTTTIEGSLYVTGTVTGSYYVDEENSYKSFNITQTGGDSDTSNSNRIIVDGGSITLTASTSTDLYTNFITENRDSRFYGSMYMVEGTGTNAVNTIYILDFDDAVAGAIAAESEDVYVFAFGAQNYESSEDAVERGAYSVDADVSIPDGLVVHIWNALVVSEEATLTVEDGGEIELVHGVRTSNSSAVLWVDGKVVDYDGVMGDYENTNIGDTKNGIFMYEVMKTTDTDSEYYVTYTTLPIAISESQAGDVIELNNKVVITENLTIPTDVTVVTDDDEIATGEVALEVKGATLTIDGILEVSVAGQKVAVTTNNDTNRDGSIVLNNVIYRADETTFTDGSNGTYTVAGAYFTAQLEDDSAPVAYVTSIAFAADNSASVDDQEGITIRGNIAMGDVTFTAGENIVLGITIINGDRETADAGTVTLVGEVDFEVQGTFNGTISGANSTVQLGNVSGIMVSTDADDSGETTVYDMVIGTLNGSYTEGTVTITGGTVYTADGQSIVECITVSSGATLIIPEGSSVFTLSPYFDEMYTYITDTSNDQAQREAIRTIFNALGMDNNLPGITSDRLATLSGFNVEGNVNVEGTLTIGIGQIDGTVDVTGNSGNLTILIALINGTVNNSENSTAIAILPFINGSMSGEFELISAVAYPGSDISNALFNSEDGETSVIDSTSIYINGSEFATMYANEDFGTLMTSLGVTGFSGLPISSILLVADIPGYDEDTAQFFSDSSMLNSITGATGSDIADAYSALIDAMRNGSGANAAGKALLNALNGGAMVGDYESVYIKMDPSLIAGTITEYQGVNVYIDGLSLNNIQMEVDENNQYTGKYLLSVGTHTITVQLSPGLSGTPEITLNGQVVTGNTFEITGDMTSFQIVVSGDVSYDMGSSDSGSSDGMGLTDYLLIILVVLIVIMAIMVAMRLMRS